MKSRLCCLNILKINEKSHESSDLKTYCVTIYLEMEVAMSLSWTEDLKIGLETIDREHKDIFEEFDRLYALMRSGGGHDFYKMVLNFLVEYISAHLKNEEALMASINYDDLDNHKEKHDFFKDKVIETEAKHRVSKISNHDLIELNLMLQSWLRNHILKEDVKIVAFIEKNNIEIKNNALPK